MSGITFWKKFEGMTIEDAIKSLETTKYSGEYRVKWPKPWRGTMEHKLNRVNFDTDDGITITKVTIG